MSQLQLLLLCFFCQSVEKHLKYFGFLLLVSFGFFEDLLIDALHRPQ